ncbi:MAG: hypothetical protein AAGG01_05095, partial [Planctomycetota bacterium]
MQLIMTKIRSVAGSLAEVLSGSSAIVLLACGVLIGWCEQAEAVQQVSTESYALESANPGPAYRFGRRVDFDGTSGIAASLLSAPGDPQNGWLYFLEFTDGRWAIEQVVSDWPVSRLGAFIGEVFIEDDLVVVIVFNE